MAVVVVVQVSSGSESDRQGRSQDGDFFIVRGPNIQIYIKN